MLHNAVEMWHASVGKTAQLVQPTTGSVVGPFVTKAMPKGKENTFCLKVGPRGRGNLRMKVDGSLDFGGGQGKWAQFEVHQTCSSAAFGAQDQFTIKGVGSGRILAVNQEGKAFGAPQDSAAAVSLGVWRLELMPATAAAATATAKPKGTAPQTPSVVKWLVSTSTEGVATKYGPFELTTISNNNNHAAAAAANPVLLLGCGPGGSGNLRVGPRGGLNMNGGRGKWARYTLASASDGATLDPSACGPDTRVQLRSVGNKDKGWALAAARNHLVGNVPFASDADGATVFTLADFAADAAATATQDAGAGAGAAQWSAQIASARAEYDDSVAMADEQKQYFVDHGFVQVKQAVPQDVVGNALRAINAALLTPGGCTVDEDGNQKFCKSISGSPAILDLLYASPVWTYAQQLLGKGQVKRAQGGQIALRGPNENLAASVTNMDDPAISPKQWHIDGMGKGKHSPFSLLVGITLSDVSGPNRGNLCVFPGSHAALLPIIKGDVNRGLVPLNDQAAKPSFDNGLQLTASAGDAVFVHQKTAHRGGPNASANIRYQVYFRLSHKNHEDNVQSGKLLDDLWVEFEGLRR